MSVTFLVVMTLMSPSVLAMGAVSLSQSQKERMLASYYPQGTHQLQSDLIIRLALKNSTKMQLIRNESTVRSQAFVMASSILDTKIYATATMLSDSNKQIAAFVPDSSKRVQVSSGIAKRLSSGTSIQVDFLVANQSMEFSPSATIPGLNLPGNVNETAIEAKARQSLLRDGFGKATRLGMHAAALKAKETDLAVRELTWNFVLETLDLYYHTWLKKELLEAAKQRLEAQQRLLKVVRKLYHVGTADKADYLEAQAAQLQLESALQYAEDQFFRSWRMIVIEVGLPMELIDLAPSRIPLILDKSHNEASELCLRHDSSAAKKFETPSLLRSRVANHASQYQLAANYNLQKPDVYLELGLRQNSLEKKWDANFADAAASKNPRHYVGLGVEIMLGDDALKSEAMGIYKNLKQSEFSENEVRTHQATQWANLCSQLSVIESQRIGLEQSLTTLKERHQLQEERFRLGRIPSFELIRSANSVTDTRQAIAVQLAERSSTAWKLKAMALDLDLYIAKLQAQSKD